MRELTWEVHMTVVSPCHLTVITITFFLKPRSSWIASQLVCSLLCSSEGRKEKKACFFIGESSELIVMSTGVWV
jgi:hypothetical protein